MSDTILILGNGFDIAMGRKTKYTDFIEFEQRLFDRPESDLQAFLDSKNIDIDKYKDNLYLKFINENKDTLGDNWSNLETMISQLSEAVMYCKENTDLLYSIGYNEPFLQHIERNMLQLQKDRNYCSKSYVGRLFFSLFYEKGWKKLEREVALDKLNNEFIRQLDLLVELLEIYLSYIDFLDFKVI